MGICDVFEWLAVMDVISFEDFEFAAVLHLLVPQVFGIAHSCLREFRLASDKRFFLIHGSDAGGHVRFCAADIACIYSSTPLLPGAALDDAARCFSAVAGQGARTCLLYTCEGTALGRSLAEKSGAAACIEWMALGPNAKRQWRSGLILSSNWREGVSGHAIKTISNYMQTHARSGRASAPEDLRGKG
ncbi:hypothetical protein XthCFBP4691_15805 [Xanthomonas theicola]|uniref:Uncharacterized protein n=2 Tax=Xanthomonas theicola TaxID=56464 RepID=A0A2S6ZCC9_9XANT|nr:hypothetical protein XthCFBP4691_15805 [Xanthomonas theicola]